MERIAVNITKKPSSHLPSERALVQKPTDNLLFKGELFGVRGSLPAIGSCNSQKKKVEFRLGSGGHHTLKSSTMSLACFLVLLTFLAWDAFTTPEVVGHSPLRGGER